MTALLLQDAEEACGAVDRQVLCELKEVSVARNHSAAALETESDQLVIARILGVSQVIRSGAQMNVSIRDLRNHGGDVVDRATRGEPITITRAGKAVAELRPVAPDPPSAEALLARWQALPALDAVALRRDIDELLDERL